VNYIDLEGAGINVVAALEPDLFPDMIEGWLVPYPLNSAKVQRLVRKGWRATPSGPFNTAVVKVEV
jgi:hypothetical protein